MPKMEVRSTECIREYIEHFYQGGLIGISDMSDYCHIIEGELYKTLLDMLSLAGVVASAVILGPFDGLSFEAFVVTRLVPNLWPGACVVMDNCSIHKDDAIREWIEAAGARLVYLPPYSPDFSPIETFWSKLKSILKTLGARTYKALVEALETAFRNISEVDIKSWFSHCCYCPA